MPNNKRQGERPWRLVIIADLHSGHVVGLTHPDFDAEPKRVERGKLYRLRRDLWDWYAAEIDALKPVDVLIVNGDCIEGKGDKSGGTELLTTDRDEQCDMAAEAIKHVGASSVFMTFGTPYHVGHLEDSERRVAKVVNAVKIGSHDWLNVGGVVFDYRHFVPGSQIPHGRHTAAAREWLWSTQWAGRGEYPRPDVVLRSHVHYFDFCGNAEFLGITTPALQWYGSKYGARRMSGTVDFGFLHFDIRSRGDWEWHHHILRRKDGVAAVATRTL